MRATAEFSLVRPRLNPCAGGASILPPPAPAGKPTREERHGQGSDAQHQGKEETEGGVEQEEEKRPHPLAVRVGTGAGSARPESLRQEELAARPIDGRGASPSLPSGEARSVKAGGHKASATPQQSSACCRVMRIRFPRRAITIVGLIAPRHPALAGAAGEQFEI